MLCNLKLIIAGLSLVMSAVKADISLANLGTSFSVSDSIKITWVDDGSNPSIDDLSSLTILFCTGPNDEIKCFDSIPFENAVSVSSLDGAYTADLSKIASVGTDGPYFFQFYAIDSTDDITTIHYTTRFNMTGMTGSYKASYDGSFSAAPSQISSGNSAAATINSASFTIYYTAQTGISRYAPMQTQPGTKVTLALSPSAKFPSTSVSYFSTLMASPSQLTTITPGWNYTFTSNTNYAAAAATPSYYYAASKHQEARISAVRMKKAKRWLDVK